MKSAAVFGLSETLLEELLMKNERQVWMLVGLLSVTSIATTAHARETLYSNTQVRQRRGVVSLKVFYNKGLTDPIRELAFSVQHRPKVNLFKITWDSLDGFGGMIDFSGLAIYDRRSKTVELFQTEHMVADSTTRRHYIYQGVTEAKLQKTAKLKEVTGDEGQIFTVADNFESLLKAGCKKIIDEQFDKTAP